MKRNFIFVLILLATLSMVNAIPHQLHKRTTSFTACPKERVGDVALLTVTMSPDPLVPGQIDTFTVSGKLQEDITSDTLIGVNFADSSGKVIGAFARPICTGDVKCPIPANTDFQTTAEVPVPSTLPTENYYVVALTGTPGHITGCANHLPTSLSSYNTDLSSLLQFYF